MPALHALPCVFWSHPQTGEYSSVHPCGFCVQMPSASAAPHF
jgi:hypothetical protein